MADGGSLDGLHYLIRRKKSDGLLACRKTYGLLGGLNVKASVELIALASPTGVRLNDGGDQPRRASSHTKL